MMADESQDHVDQLFFRLDELQKNANVNAVFGPPVTQVTRQSFPSRVTYGFGLDLTRRAKKAKAIVPPAEAGASKPLGLAEITPERTRIEPIVMSRRWS
jgi:hypothetical protein